MGHDYSYSQPDSSDEHYVEDDSIDNERDALIRMDEGETSLMIQRALHMDAEETRFILAQNSQYPPQPEVDFGIPKVCYCGGVPILSTAYHNNARGRMYFTCNNVEDGEMHIHKWWEEAVMEGMRDKDRLLEVLSSQVDSLNYLPETESEDKIVKLEKAIGDLVENINRYRNGFHLVIGVIGFIGLVLASFVYWGKMP